MAVFQAEVREMNEKIAALNAPRIVPKEDPANKFVANLTNCIVVSEKGKRVCLG